MKRLYLNHDKKIFGVCGGIAEYMGTDPTAVRLFWVLLTILTGIVPGVLAYFLVAIIMPPTPDHKHSVA